MAEHRDGIMLIFRPEKFPGHEIKVECKDELSRGFPRKIGKIRASGVRS